jgi:hypothetical protein
MTISNDERIKDNSGKEFKRDVLPSGRSYLLADCGHTTTTLMLFDDTAGSYRFLARGSALTTAGPPWFDVTQGFRQAINQISAITGRVLLGDDGTLIRPGRPDGTGVDYFGAVMSAAEPHKTLILGLLEDVSLASVRRALHAIYSEEYDRISINDRRSTKVQVESLLENQPDLVVLAGGTDGGAEGLVLKQVDKLVTAISLMDASERPSIIFAGNKELQSRISEVFADLTSVYISENVRPQRHRERLDQLIRLLSDLYIRERINELPGIQKILEWNNYPLIPTAHALGAICEYFSSLYSGRVLCLDVGSDNVTLIEAKSGRVNLQVRSDLGLGKPVAAALSNGSTVAVEDWLLSKNTPEMIADRILNKSLHPSSIPLSAEEMGFEHAFLRQVVRKLVVEAEQSGNFSMNNEIARLKLLLLHGGVFGNSPRPGQALLSALDSLQPVGVFRCYLDLHGLLPVMGLIAPVDPQLVVQVLDSGVLLELGTVIAPLGDDRDGEIVLSAIVESGDTDPIEIDLIQGELKVLPLASGEQVIITIQPSVRYDIGSGLGKARKLRVHGGDVGLVFDARGRPLMLPKSDDIRRQQLELWHREVRA